MRVLDDDEVIFNGVRFLEPLWTDFMLSARARSERRRVKRWKFMRDFSGSVDDADERLSPADSAALFDIHARWLDRKLAKPYVGPTVVITHHTHRGKASTRDLRTAPERVLRIRCRRLADGTRACPWVWLRMTASTMS